MFLRSNHRIKDGKDHTYWSLVETVRTPDGPRQRTLCYLGELNGSAQARWLKTIEVFNEQGEAEQLKLFPSHIEPPEDDPQVARVLLNQVRLERTRQFGACYLGLELWKRLELDHFFEEAIDEAPADVPWSRIAALLTINRLCAPGSELAVEQRWYPSTALDDLLGIEEGKINDTRLYRCLDQILPHKTKLEGHLKERYGSLFGAEFDVLLYDLTSTYVEGAAEDNPMMRRGYSRDHRPDCEQMVIALIVNSEGFPFSYETFDGNRADVSTVETMLRMVERKYGKARRIWIFDRGIVSEENLAAIRKRGGQYLVGTPRRQMKRFEAELVKEDWTRVRPEVEVKKVANPQAETPEELWSKYMQLTEAEASFRALKSELSIRPLFHQKERRVKAHVLVAFLGYALWVTLKHLLQRRPALIPKPAAADVGNTQPLTPMQALALLSKLHSGDIVLPTTDGREIRLRRVTEPTAEQKSLLDLLGSSLPDRLSFNRQCSVDSAIA